MIVSLMMYKQLNGRSYVRRKEVGRGIVIVFITEQTRCYSVSLWNNYVVVVSADLVSHSVKLKCGFVFSTFPHC